MLNYRDPYAWARRARRIGRRTGVGLVAVATALALTAGWVAWVPAERAWAQDDEPYYEEEYIEPDPQAEVDEGAEYEEYVEEEEPVLRPVAPQRPAPPARPQPIRPSRVQPTQVRPGTTPAAPGAAAEPNPYRPKEGAAATEPVSIDYEGVELQEIVKAIGAATGRNFLLDPQIGAIPVTLISHAPVPANMLLDVLQAVLVTHGFTMRDTLDGKLIKIRPIDEEGENAPLVVGSTESTARYDDFVTHIVPVRYASAEELARLLPRLGSRTATVDAYGPTNTLILSDNARGIENMLTFLAEIDVPGSEVVMETFTLDYARAEVVAEQIREVLMGDEGVAGDRAAAVARARAPQPVRPTVRTPVSAQAQQTIIGSEEPVLQIVAVDRLNMLIVRANESLMQQVRSLVDRLDVQTPIEANNLHVYPLLNADAESVAEKLNAVIGLTPRAASDQGGGDAQAAITEVQPFEKKVLVEAYPETKSLLVVAAPQDYEVIKELIAQLDVARRQVHIEALIMEVNIQDRYQLGVELSSLSAEDGFALNNVISLANIMANGPLAGVGGSDSPVLTTGVLDGVVYLPVAGEDGALTLQAFPKIPLLLTALDSITDLDVLSQPLLTTVDNEEGKVTIGQEVPVTTGTQSSLNQSASNSSVYSRIERKDVGIKMTVQPQISEGDNIFLELEVEVSQPIQSSVGADPNIVGPTFSKSNIQTPLIVRDGSTAVVGGLISESIDRSTRQTPYFGDVPVVGWLFRRKNDQRSKRNLVVLVTPHVIKEGVDTDRITDYRLDEFGEANADVVFEQGFVERIRRRHETRTQHHPSGSRVERLRTNEFDRGELR